MSNLIQRWEKEFFPFFQKLENEDCLLQMLNSFLALDQPLVSAFFYTEGEEVGETRENVSKYAVIAFNQDRDQYQVTLLFTEDSQSQGYFMRAFSNMASMCSMNMVNSLQKTYCMAVHFQEKPENWNDLEEEKSQFKNHKRTFSLQSEEVEPSTCHLSQQRYTIFNLEKLPSSAPTSTEDAWLSFLNDPTTPPSLEEITDSACLKRGFAFPTLKEEEKSNGRDNVVYQFKLNPEQEERTLESARESFDKKEGNEEEWENYCKRYLEVVTENHDKKLTEALEYLNTRGLTDQDLAATVQLTLRQLHSFQRKMQVGFHGFEPF